MRTHPPTALPQHYHHHHNHNNSNNNNNNNNGTSAQAGSNLGVAVAVFLWNRVTRIAVLPTGITKDTMLAGLGWSAVNLFLLADHRPHKTPIDQLTPRRND